MNKLNEEYEKKRNRQVAGMRSILDYAMGLVIICIGFFMLFRSRLKLSLNELYPPDKWDLLFGAVCICYGAWRLYRGYKKNYFK